MSDKITKRDAVYLAIVAELHDGKGWHGKGIPTTDFSRENLAPVLFDHTFTDAGIILPDGTFHKTGERYAVNLNDGMPLGGAVGARYNTPSNMELFDLFTDALAGGEYEVCSCGTVDSCIEFYVDAKSKAVRAAGRDIVPFVGLHRQFGGFSRVLVSGHNTVIQCGNTTRLFVMEAVKSDELISTKNTLNVHDRLPKIKAAIERQHGVQGEFIRAMEAAALVLVDKDTATRAYVGACVGEAEKKLSTRTVNRVNRLNELRIAGAGSEGQNAADWFNGYTDYMSHESSGGLGGLEACKTPEEYAVRLADFKDKQWHSSEFGTAARVKADMAGLLFKAGEFNTEGFEGLVVRGRKAIDTAEKDVLAELA